VPVTGVVGAVAKLTGKVAIAVVPSESLTNTGVATGASTVKDPALSVTGVTGAEAIDTG